MLTATPHIIQGRVSHATGREHVILRATGPQDGRSPPAALPVNLQQSFNGARPTNGFATAPHPATNNGDAAQRHLVAEVLGASRNGSNGCRRDLSTSTLVQAGEFVLPLTPRATDIDQFAVVSNHRIVCDLEHARYELLEHEGVGMATSLVYAVTELNVKYRGPIRLGDRLLATVLISSLTAARCTFSQRIIVLHPTDAELDRVAVEAEVVVVTLSGSYRPIRIPLHLRQALSRYLKPAPCAPV